MQKKSGNYRNKLGLAYKNNSEYSLAIQQFEIAIDINPNNSSFYFNLGDAYENLENYDAALDAYYKSRSLDEDDYSPPIRIAQILFHEKNQKSKAYEVLDESIYADGKVDFLDFFTIFTKTRFYAMENKKTKLNQELKKIVEIAKSPEEKNIASYLLVQEALMIAEYQIFDIAEKFAKAGCEMKPDDFDLKELASGLLKNSNIVEQNKKIQDSKYIDEFVKAIVQLYVSNYFGSFETNEEFVETHQMAIDNLFVRLDFSDDNRSIKNSVRRIKETWNDIYSVNSKLFDAILEYRGPTKYSSDCPECFKPFNVSIGAYATYTCPNCSSFIDYSISGYSSRRSSSNCFVAGAVYKDTQHPQVLYLRTLEIIFEKIFIWKIIY